MASFVSVFLFLGYKPISGAKAMKAKISFFCLAPLPLVSIP